MVGPGGLEPPTIQRAGLPVPVPAATTSTYARPFSVVSPVVSLARFTAARRSATDRCAYRSLMVALAIRRSLLTVQMGLPTHRVTRSPLTALRHPR